MESITLLHGTATHHIDSVQEEGLRKCPHLSSSVCIASYFAWSEVDRLRCSGQNTDPCIVGVTVSVDNLHRDEPALNEPLFLYRELHSFRTDEGWFEGIENGTIPYPESPWDWQTSLEATTCVSHSGVIKPENLSFVLTDVPPTPSYTEWQQILDAGAQNPLGRITLGDVGKNEVRDAIENFKARNQKLKTKERTEQVQ